ncbi:MAG TPA: FAD-dependent thymidylate synthase [Candidatus Woesebacteria bacterium]|nr:FAD-dependent thymidylate synthase [Candidatus Woesebacteria bacterium]
MFEELKIAMAEIIRQIPKFLILDNSESLRQQLLKIEIAGRTSYQSEKGEVTLESATKFAKMLISRGHESVLEHTSTSVKFLDNSIGMMRELNRHRIASVTEESTRYVDNSELKFIFPRHKEIKERVNLTDGSGEISIEKMVNTMEIYYRSLRKAGWSPEEARSFLPLGLNSEEVFTANWREWRHVFELRTAKAAHFEIRSTMVEVLNAFKEIIPGVFDDFERSGVDKNGYPYYEKRIK